MNRIPEPAELMDDAAQAQAYAEADFSEPNALFIQCFAARFDDRFSGRAIDLGCGPADIAIAFAQRYRECIVDVVDGARAMLEIARHKLAKLPELHERFNLAQLSLPCAELPQRAYDAVLSNSLLHHLSDPAIMWQTVKHCAKPGAAICLMDLARPASIQAVDALVTTYAAAAPDLLRRDFRNSLFAAYRPAEVKAQLRAAGLTACEVHAVSDRHLAVLGRCP